MVWEGYSRGARSSSRFACRGPGQSGCPSPRGRREGATRFERRASRGAITCEDRWPGATDVEQTGAGRGSR
eukprot:9479354-Pyramimonas_sp.AAC.1